MHKTIYDILSLGGKAVINGQEYSADEIMIVGTTEKMMSCMNFINNKGPGIVLGVDITSNKLSALSEEQCHIYYSGKELHKRRFSGDSVSQRINYKSCCYADEFGELISLLKLHATEAHISSKLLIGGNGHEVVWYSLVGGRTGDSLIAAVAEKEMSESLYLQSLYQNIDFIISFSDYDLKYRGITVHVEKTDHGDLFYIQPYPMEVMQSTKGKGTVFRNIMNPFAVMDFVVNHADSGVTGVVYPDSGKKAVHNYIVVGVINNIDITIEDCVVGTVRIGKSIDAAEDFWDALSAIDDVYTIAWVNVEADSPYNAFSEGKKALTAAEMFLSFMIKNDVYADWFGAVDINNNIWDVRSHYPKISLGTIFYIENCITGESITITDENIKVPSEIILDGNAEYLFEYEWIEALFRNLQAGNKKILRLQYAIQWVVQAWNAEDPYDKIIYCSTALEFIVNGEKGINILDEYAAKADKSKFTKAERRKVIDTLVGKAKVEEISDWPADIISALNESIEKMIRAKLTEFSFATKLDTLISRLSIPVINEEKDVLKKARLIRNELIHGIEMASISTLDMKKLCGVTSRILLFKLIDELRKD